MSETSNPYSLVFDHFIEYPKCRDYALRSLKVITREDRWIVGLEMEYKHVEKQEGILLKAGLTSPDRECVEASAELGAQERIVSVYFSLNDRSFIKQIKIVTNQDRVMNLGADDHSGIKSGVCFDITHKQFIGLLAGSFSLSILLFIEDTEDNIVELSGIVLGLHDVRHKK